MTRTIAATWEAKDYGASPTLEVTLDLDSAAGFCAALALPCVGRSGKLALIDQRTSKRLQVTVNEQHVSLAAHATWSIDSTAREALLAFLLDYWLAGTSTVTHIDLDATHSSGRAGEVVAYVSDVSPALSPEELRRHLE